MKVRLSTEAILVMSWMAGACWLSVRADAAPGDASAAPPQPSTPQRAASHAFPRVALRFPPSLRKHLPDIAKFDQLMTGAQHFLQEPELTRELRRLNPNILLAVYCDSITVRETPVSDPLGEQAREYVKAHNLFLRDIRGNPMYLHSGVKDGLLQAGVVSLLVNKYKNDFQWPRWQAKKASESFDWSLFDGMHWDDLETGGTPIPNAWYGYSHQNKIEADINEDGQTDDPGWASRRWVEANRLFLQDTSRHLPLDKIVHNNAVFHELSYSYSNQHANGAQNENTFSQGAFGNDFWLAEMTGLWKIEQRCRKPAVNVLAVEQNRPAKWPEEVKTAFKAYAECQDPAGRERLGRQVDEAGRTNWQFMRYGLASCLLSDAYFAMSGPLDDYAFVEALWWYDEFDNAGEGKGYLGYPKGKAHEIGQYPWISAEDFEGGVRTGHWKINSEGTRIVQDENLVLKGHSSLLSGKARSGQLPPAVLESVPDKMGLEPNTTYVLSFEFRILERPCRDFFVSNYEAGNLSFAIALHSIVEDEGYDGAAINSFTTRTSGKTCIGFHLRNFWTRFPEKFAYGNVVMDNLRIRRLGAWRRDYDNGIVLCNPTSKPVRVELERKYRKIRGKQCPEVNDGSAVDAVVIPAFDGLVLLRR